MPAGVLYVTLTLTRPRVLFIQQLLGHWGDDDTCSAADADARARTVPISPACGKPWLVHKLTVLEQNSSLLRRPVIHEIEIVPQAKSWLPSTSKVKMMDRLFRSTPLVPSHEFIIDSQPPFFKSAYQDRHSPIPQVILFE